MFYNFFKSAGKTKEQAMEMAAYNANKYMVEYNYLEQENINLEEEEEIDDELDFSML